MMAVFKSEVLRADKYNRIVYLGLQDQIYALKGRKSNGSTS